MSRSIGSFLGVASILSLLTLSAAATAQTFNGSVLNTAGNSSIPSAGTGGCTVAPQTTGGTVFNVAVAGLPAGIVLGSVRLNLTHTFDGDLDLYLRAPNGELLELSTDNGGGGEDFTDTVLLDGAPSIITGTSPFTGTFAPEGSLASSTCGTNITPTVTTLGGFTPGQNGTWELVIKDDAGADVGTMIGWSLSFGLDADLTIAMTDAPDPVTAGNDLTYTVTLTNTGPDAALNAAFTVPLPPGTSLVSATPSTGGACVPGASIVCTWAGLTPNAAVRTATLVVRVAADTASGASLDTSATASAITPDSDPDDNAATASTTVDTSADLVLSFGAAPLEVLAGEPVTFTATSLNQGPSDAQDVEVTVTLTPDFRYSSHTASAGAVCATPPVGDTGAVSCTWAGATAPGTPRTLAVEADNTTGGTTTVDASTSSLTPDPMPDDNLAAVSVLVTFPALVIPALSPSGLILLGLVLGLLGIVAMRRQL